MNIIIILNLAKSQRYRQSFVISNIPVSNPNLVPISSEGDREFIPTDETDGTENRETETDKNENENEM